MEFDILLKLLNEKIVSLRNEVERAEKNKSEIAHLQDIIRKVKDDPYCLYTSDSGNVVKLLGYSPEQLQEIEKWKGIYRLYIQYGMDEDIIPQISIVDEGTKKIEEDLERKVMLLSDVVSRYQAISLGCQSYENLLNEVKDNGAYITEVKALLELLNGSNLGASELNKIKRAVIARNNLIYHKTREVVLDEQRKTELAKKAVQEETVVVEGTDENKDNVEDNNSLNDAEVEVSVSPVEETFDTEEEREIAELNKKLEKTFGKCTIERMQELIRTILSCENEEQVNEFLEGFKPSYGEKYLEMVDGLISLMKIDILTAKYLADDVMVEKYSKSLESLEEHRNSLVGEQQLEAEDSGIDIEGLKDFEKALQEYDPNPLSSINQVIFLHNAVGRNIADIADKETLQDIFVLIEKFKKGEKEPIAIKDLELKELKPNQRHRQARVMLLHISNNVYGVAFIDAKKSNTLPFKKLKNREIKGFEAIKKIESGEVSMTDLVDYTRKQMDKLVSRISTKTTNMKGGLA